MNQNSSKSMYLYLDLFLILLGLSCLAFFRADLVVISAFLLSFGYILFTKRNLLFFYLAVSFLIAGVWMLFARNVYGYNQDYITVFGINLFPLFSFTMCLFALYLLYSHYENNLIKYSFKWRLGMFTAIYWSLLISVEVIGYHVLNINNVATSPYKGLPFCNCMHAPVWMQFSYFFIGIIFFLLCSLSILKNPQLKSPMEYTL